LKLKREEDLPNGNISILCIIIIGGAWRRNNGKN
jgi:hypothetical protein